MSSPDSASTEDEIDLEAPSGAGADPLAVLLAGRDRFVAFVRGRVGSPAFADDVVQSAFAKALEQQAALRDASHATAWFYRILRNEIVD